ncbi:CDP-glycerol glycerophosphotransferase family protein [Alteromonas sp. H39]|uniref:CDP-glycerol glycerophosphotransferase family protein n=1 Tax=Alteromonas sp. H39 TaxID=3389876 RepID=UPI0039E18D78
MRFVLYISQNYSFEILRPLAAEMIKDKHEVRWFVEGHAVNQQLFRDDEKRLGKVRDVVDFNPDAVFLPGNVVPAFIPGLKVQVFHGFEWKKKGHFRIRECFDLYCTQGPFFTQAFEKLRERHPHFTVKETGWPKLDPLFAGLKATHTNEVPTILFAPTFSPKLTSAPALIEQIKTLSQSMPWKWLIKFHPKMDAETIQAYKDIASDNLNVVESQSILPLLQQCDVMVSDTSSAITEFLLMKKPVVTFNNAQPEDVFIDITQAEMLGSAIETSLNLSNDQRNNIEAYANQMHPYTDGQSARRILEATLEEIRVFPRHGNVAKPRNVIRNLKLRKRLGYWTL